MKLTITTKMERAYAYRQLGMSYKAIGAKMRVSYARVQQYLNKREWVAIRIRAAAPLDGMYQQWRPLLPVLREMFNEPR